MGGTAQHAHVEAALAAALAWLSIHGLAWLLAFSMPSTVLGLPWPIVSYLGLYVLLYALFRRRWA